MTLLWIVLAFTAIWFLISWIIIEGSDPFLPTPVNRFASVVRWIVKILLFFTIFLGVTGYLSDIEKKFKL
jgi:glucan phosphoethanolaminetransferase (alkaline phosphatase superfamily)